MFGNGPAKYVYASAFDQMRHQKERLERELLEARDNFNDAMKLAWAAKAYDYNKEEYERLTSFLGGEVHSIEPEKEAGDE
jgi:hypothetical protein